MVPMVTPADRRRKPFLRLRRRDGRVGDIIPVGLGQHLQAQVFPILRRWSRVVEDGFDVRNEVGVELYRLLDERQDEGKNGWIHR